MHSHYSVVVSLFFFVEFTGCSTVDSRVQLGKPISAEEALKFEGVWMNFEDEPILVRHVKKNELRLAFVGWEGSRFELEEGTVYLTEDDDQQYVNMLEEDSTKETPSYGFARLTMADGDCLLFYYPKVETFAKGIEDGALTGTVKKLKDDKLSVHIESSPEEFQAFVHPSKVAEQFEFDKPFVFRRVGKSDRVKE